MHVLILSDWFRRKYGHRASVHAEGCLCGSDTANLGATWLFLSLCPLLDKLSVMKFYYKKAACSNGQSQIKLRGEGTLF